MIDEGSTESRVSLRRVCIHEKKLLVYCFPSYYSNLKVKRTENGLHHISIVSYLVKSISGI